MYMYIYIYIHTYIHTYIYTLYIGDNGTQAANVMSSEVEVSEAIPQPSWLVGKKFVEHLCKIGASLGHPPMPFGTPPCKSWS